MEVFRLHIRPTGGKASNELSVKHCLQNRIAGVGWNVGRGVKSWDDYCNAIEEKGWYKSKIPSKVKYLYNNVKVGSAIWMRDVDGIYHVAKVIEPWQYCSDQAYIDADIVNFVKVDKWIEVDIDAVPGSLIASFRARSALQRANSKSTNILTRFHLGEKIRLTKDEFFSSLDSEDIEDVVFIMLQLEDYIIIPSSRKGDTMSYEFFALKGNEKIITQVKTGKASIDASEYQKYDKVYLYQEFGLIKNLDNSDNVIVIDKLRLLEIIEKYFDHLPKRIQTMYSLFDKSGPLPE